VITVVGADRCADHCRRLQTYGIDVPKAMEDVMLHAVTTDDCYMKGAPFGASEAPSKQRGDPVIPASTAARTSPLDEH
jgi:hypothetical protein